MGHFYLGVILIYLGSLGRMIGIKCPASQNVQAEERHSFSTTLEGRRKVQVKPTGRRTWSLQTSDATTPQEHSLLSQFAHGAWGLGPFIFVSADAPHTNMLTPASSMCIPVDPLQDAVMEGGPVDLPGVGWVARSYISGSPTTYVVGREIYPVPPDGGPVTAQAFVQGANARARLNWYDAQKAYLGSTTSTVTGTGLGFSLSWVTGVPPVGAVGVGVGALTTTAIAAPSLTWGDKPVVWAAGEGCLEAVVHAPSRELVLTGPGRTFSNLGFTVSEVG